MASVRRSRDSTAPETFGAKPPSSPTFVAGSEWVKDRQNLFIEVCPYEVTFLLTINTVLGLNDFLESVVGFSTNLHGLGERGSTSREEHEFLEREFVTSVRSTVNDVEARDREDIGRLDAGKLSEMLIQRNALVHRLVNNDHENNEIK